MMGLKFGILNSSGIIPTSISNLFAWYDAADQATVTRSGFGTKTVSAWADKSGNGRTLTSGIGSETGYTSAAQNGLNCITGDGVAFMGNNSVTLYGSDYTIITASKSTTEDAGDLIGTGGTASGDILLMNNYAQHVRAHNFMNSGTSFVDSVTLTAAGINRICGQMMSGTTLSVILKDQIDGTISLTGGFGSPSPNLILCSRTGGISGFNFIGNIYEVIIYNKALSQSELTGIYSYLRNKWAITTT